MPDNITGTAVATQQRRNVLDQFKEELAERAQEFRMALPSHISADKFQRTLVTAVQQNPALLKADRRSLILACMKAAQSGLLPDGREAALVIFKNRKKINGQWNSVEEVAFIEMVYGVRKKILQARDAEGHPVVSGLLVEAVYRKEVEGGHFIYEVGLDPPIRHRPMLDLTMEDADDKNIVGAYSIATMADGNKSYKFLRRFQIDKIRETSKTGATKNRDGSPRAPSGPWVEWFSAMCEKTVLKQHAKSLPQSGDLILDADDDDSYSDRSAAALLSVPGGEPEAIEDHSDDEETPHDPETGEIIEEPVTETATDQPEAAKSEPKPRQPAKAKEEPEPVAEAEAQPEAAAEPEDAARHPGALLADQIIAEINAPENNAVMDVSRIMTKHELDLAAMLDEDAVRVEIAADKRRNAIRKEQEAAKAKEAAE
jgi:recombination protein RecT